MTTALPRTSRPAKSAAVPRPTQTASTSSPAAGGGARRGAERRQQRAERQGLAAARSRHVPTGGKPLRRQRELGTIDVHHAEFAELRFEQIGGHRFVLGTRDAAPVLVAVVAALP